MMVSIQDKRKECTSNVLIFLLSFLVISPCDIICNWLWKIFGRSGWVALHITSRNMKVYLPFTLFAQIFHIYVLLGRYGQLLYHINSWWISLYGILTYGFMSNACHRFLIVKFPRTLQSNYGLSNHCDFIGWLLAILNKSTDDSFGRDETYR